MYTCIHLCVCVCKYAPHTLHPAPGTPSVTYYVEHIAPPTQPEHTHTHRQRERERARGRGGGRERERESDRERGREGERESERQREAGNDEYVSSVKYTTQRAVSNSTTRTVEICIQIQRFILRV